MEETRNKYELDYGEESRKKVKVGDVFVIKIESYDVYFYGKVICDGIELCGSKDYRLIFLYKTPTKEIIIPKDMNENDILIPFILERSGWLSGCFKTVCNIPVKDSEINADYGFCSLHHAKWISKNEVDAYAKNHRLLPSSNDRIIAAPYVDSFFNVLDHKPALINDLSLFLLEAVRRELSAHLIRNPEIEKEFGLV